MSLDKALAGTVGRYSEFAPSARLQPHFRCVWTHAVPADHTGAIAVVPDGCVDLLWRDGRLMVAGPDLTAALPDLRPGSTILGMRFQPGAATRWLGLPMTEIVGREVELTEFWGNRAHELTGRLSEKTTTSEQAQLLQQLLLGVTADIEPVAQDAAAIFSVAGRASREGNRAMSLLLDRLDVSERTLRRRSHDYFGYGPKTLSRILRFQRFLSLARSDRSARLSALAFDAGYADQPHLSREIQSLCGMTALTFLRQLRP
ncbi:helix-turn-helix domain-containing protein [Mesorhizobium sp. BAC0120]|nr:helix-turn-helix domain-containing protein [Mesorhizobium sp. BAC0120]MDW6021833.1 helix-turn-helix domain-containing protein [Mesorhizobium sp. BAC0120]